MSDPRFDQTLKVGDTEYVLRFTHAALIHAEKLLGRPVPDLAMMVGSGQFGFAELAALVTAGLEGARRKLRLATDPWTLDAVHDLLDDADDFDSVAEPMVMAFDAAMRKWFPELFEEADAVLGSGDQDPPMAAGTGTDSSEPPSAPASASTTSGS